MSVRIREFGASDAEAVSALIQQTMRVSNSRDYAAERLQPLIDYFTPAKVQQLAAERYCLVAEMTDRIVATAALDGDQIVTFFVEPAHQGSGIGVDGPGESVLPLPTDGLRPGLHQHDVGLEGDVRIPPGPHAVPLLGIAQLVDVGKGALGCLRRFPVPAARTQQRESEDGRESLEAHDFPVSESYEERTVLVPKASGPTRWARCSPPSGR